MPYTKRRKSYYPRRKRSSGWLGKAGSAISTASKALSVAYGVKKLLNTEFKVHDVEDTTDMSSTANVVRLSGIAQGDDMSQREGRSIRCKYLDIKHYVSINASGTTAAGRVIVFIDYDSNSNAPAATDLLKTEDYMAPRNVLTDQKRFKVLWDKTFTVSINGSRSWYFKKFIRLNHHVKYDGTTNSSDGYGKIYVLMISNTSTNNITSKFSSRLRFIDN